MKKKQLIIITIVSFLGWILSILLGKIGIDVLLDPSHVSFCNFNASFNCDSVALSEFSSHFGIPNFVYGIIFYAVVLVASLYKLISKKEIFINFFVYLFAASAGAVLVSLYLFLVSHLAIHSFCILCMMVYVVNIILLLVALWAEDFSVDTIIRKLLGDIKVLFTSFARTAIFFVILIGVSVTLIYFSKNPLLGQVQPETAGNTNVSSTGGIVANAERLVHGSAGSPELTLVVFSDYECSFCGRANGEIEKLLKANPGIRIVYKDYPLDNSCNPRMTRPFHQYACQAAFAARCAAEQGKFWEYHDKLYSGSLKAESIQEYAKELNLDLNNFNRCLESKKYNDKLQTDIDEAVALGVEGTPTLFIEGRKVVGFKSYEEYQKIVDEIKAERQKMLEEFQKLNQEKKEE